MLHLLIAKQVPDNYIRAIFGSYLASRFVYSYGINASQFAFFDFMNKRMAKLKVAAWAKLCTDDGLAQYLPLPRFCGY